MTQTAKTVVKEFLDAVQAGNLEKVGTLLHPEVVWDQPGSNQFSGRKVSLPEVFQMVGGMLQTSGNTLALTEVKTLAVCGDSVSCLLRWQAGLPSGAQLDVDNIDVYMVEEGRITEAKVFSTDIEMEDRFWGN
jgi:ketosteroid isomerase-like protein